MLTGECCEELFESLIEAGLVDGIAWVFSNAVTNVIFVFGAVQTSKVIIKKIIMVTIRPIIKKITYKEGNDKVMKAKEIYAKVLRWLKANWQTGVGVASLVYLFLEIGFNFIGNGLAVHGVDPNIAYAILTPLYGFIVNAMAKQGFEKPEVVEQRHLDNKVLADEKAKAKANKRAKDELKAKMEKDFEMENGYFKLDTYGNPIPKAVAEEKTKEQLQAEIINEVNSVK